MRPSLRPFALLALVAALALAQEGLAPIPDAELGLARGSVFEVPTPPALVPETGDPGEAPLLPRDFEGSPPRVPHLVEDFLPITREDNLCVDCHAIAIAEAEEGEPTPLPADHYTDLRRAPDRVGETVAGARWVCVSCHVALTGAEPLLSPRPAAAKR